MRCIGIFGGTFDPIHYGHLRTALELLMKLDLEQVRFLPCGRPPHRERPLMSGELRLRMVEAAIASEPRFVADSRELERPGPSYMVDTLETLREDFPDTPLGLMLGMDAFAGLASWHEWERLTTLAHLIVAHRPGSPEPREGSLARLMTELRTRRRSDLHASLAGKVHIERVTQLEISSTDLRNSISAGVDPMYLVPPSVRDIIMQTECYAQSKDKEATG